MLISTQKLPCCCTSSSWHCCRVPLSSMHTACNSAICAICVLDAFNFSMACSSSSPRVPTRRWRSSTCDSLIRICCFNSSPSLVRTTISLVDIRSFKTLNSSWREVLPVRGDGAPRRGEKRRSRPLSPGSALPTAPVLVVSLISVVWGSSGGGALRKPSLCKQQSLNAKNKSNKR